MNKKKRSVRNEKNNMSKFLPGKKNAITDLDGVKVGHLTLNKDLLDASGEKVSIRTGLTAILPYPMEKEMRLFMGSFIFKGMNEMTGYQVGDDFCYLNSPIVLTNPFNVGLAYNTILSYGFSLNRTEIWPPLVLSVNDSFLNDMNASLMKENDILEIFRQASREAVAEGSVGIGLGLRAYGHKGGIGTASRVIDLANEKFTCGVLVASNHSNPVSLAPPKNDLDANQDEEGSFTIIFGVDIPLAPFQIKRIMRCLVFGLSPILQLNTSSDSLTCILFSTANSMVIQEDGPLLFDFRIIKDSYEDKIAQAGKEAAQEALINSLLKATSVQGREGRRCETISEEKIHRLIKNS